MICSSFPASPAIWVIIPTFNRCAVLLECLECLTRQTYPRVIAVVVEDGCSDDTSAKVLQQYPGAVLLHGSGNSWWSGSMNIGLRHVLQFAAEGDYVCSFNDDVLGTPDFFNHFLDDSRAIGYENMLGAQAVDSQRPDHVLYSGTTIDWRRGVWKGSPHPTEAGGAPVPTDSLPGRGTLYSVSALRSIGFYDEVCFPQYFGDEDFALRAKSLGIPLFVSRRARLRSHFAMTGTGRLNQSATSFLRSLFSIRSPNQLSRRARFIWRHAPMQNRLSFLLIDLLKVTTAYWRRREIRKVEKTNAAG